MENDKIAAFDTLYTSNHIQMCKLALPLMPKEKQYYGAILIKYMELNYTLSLGKYLKSQLCACSGTQEYGMENFLQEIIPFCTEKEAEKIRKATGIMKGFKTFQEIKSMMELLGPDILSPDADGGTGFSPDLLKGLLSEEQQNLFEMFMKGDSPNEG